LNRFRHNLLYMKVRDRQTDRQTNRQRKTYVKTYYTHTFITDMMRHNRPDLYSMYVLCMYVLCMYAQQRDRQTDRQTAIYKETWR